MAVCVYVFNNGCVVCVWMCIYVCRWVLNEKVAGGWRWVVDLMERVRDEDNGGGGWRSGGSWTGVCEGEESGTKVCLYMCLYI